MLTLYKKILTTLLLFFIIGCASTTKLDEKITEEIEIVDQDIFLDNSDDSSIASTQKETLQDTKKTDYQKLSEALTKTPSLETYVKDYLLYFKALDELKTKKTDEAKSNLQQALQASSDSRLKSAIQKKLTALEDTKSSAKSQSLEPLFKSPLPSMQYVQNDFLLKKTIKKACKTSTYKDAQKWARSLPKVKQNYFLAKISKCFGVSATKSIGLFKKAYKAASQRRSYAPYTLYAAKNLVLLLRVTGNRKEAANFYKKVTDLWVLKNIASKALGLTKHKFNIERINDFLWSARYSALNHNYNSAKQSIESAQHFIKQAISQVSSRRALKQLDDYRSEAFHILAFRVDVEEKKFFNALISMQKALKTPPSTTSWKERFMWYAGLYAYQSNQFQTAERYWLDLQQESKEERYQVQTRYWLSRLYTKLKRDQQAKAMQDELFERFPNSFYSLVSQDTNQKNIAKNSGTFLKKAETATKLLSQNNLREYHIRALLLTKANITEWTRPAISKLHRASLKKHSIKNNPSLYIYISNLYHKAQKHIQAISLTTKLANSNEIFWKQFPEQIKIYYPKPFQKLYAASAQKNNLEPALLYAVSRQESSFNPTVKSHAGAIGLMQLMPHTARHISKKYKLPLQNPKTGLLVPEVNINFGAKLLAKIKSEMDDFLPAIFASYNAGESTVQNWKIRRYDRDPMMWVELIPFGETQSYTKLVWRNYLVYKALASAKAEQSQPEAQ